MGIAIIGLILAFISAIIGWMGYGGLIFGIPAILIGMYVRKRGYETLGLISILLFFGQYGHNGREKRYYRDGGTE